MPDTPERDLEQQLRASAAQRRAEAGGPFELHEATRRLLQAEVARRHGSGAAPVRRNSFWLALWPRFAVGLSFAIVLGAGLTWLLVSSGSHTQPEMLASSKDEARQPLRQEQPTGDQDSRVSKAAPPPVAVVMAPQPERKLETTIPTETAPAPVATPATVTTTAARTADAQKPTDTRAEAVSALTEAAGATRETQRPFDKLGTAQGGFGGGGLPRAKVDQASAANSQAKPATLAGNSSADSVTSDTKLKELNAPVAVTMAAPTMDGRQNASQSQAAAANTAVFRNQAPPASTRSGAAPARDGGGTRMARTTPANLAVLNSFQIEQSGDRLRVVDADGSVYEGQVQAALTEAGTAAARGPQTELRPQAARPAQMTKGFELGTQTQAFNFNVTGLNRSLSQQVVFTGQLQQVVMPNTVTNQTNALFANTQNLASQSPSNRAFNQSQFAPLQNQQQRVVGRARLADARELPVDAVSAPR